MARKTIAVAGLAVSSFIAIILTANGCKVMKPIHTAPTARFVNIRNGSTLSGDIDITVEVNDSDDPPGGLFFQVDDGKDWYQVGYPELMEPVKVDSPHRWKIPFAVVTQHFSNGPHRLVLLDYDKHGKRIVDQRTVTFLNELQNVHAGGLMHENRFHEDSMSCPITATLTTSQLWVVQIKDFNEHVVKTWKGSGKTIDLRWDGTDNTGKPLASGGFYTVIQALKTRETAGEAWKNWIINLNR